jgi:hypothetical protein
LDSLYLFVCLFREQEFKKLTGKSYDEDFDDFQHSNKAIIPKIDNELLASKQSNVISSELMRKQREFYSQRDGYLVPNSLSNPWAVSKVLTQSKEKKSRQYLNKIKETKKFEMNAQAKEAMFLKRINELEEEQRRIQLKGEVRIGEQLVDEAAKLEILASRAKATRSYHVRIFFLPFRIF